MLGVLQRIWQLLTDSEAGYRVYLFLFLALLGFSFYRVSAGRWKCDDLCEARGYADAIYEPSRLANGYQPTCECLDQDGKSGEP